METTMHENTNAQAAATQVCLRCRFHPASTRLGGYCSWDCYEADDEEDEGEDGRAAA